MSNPAGTVFLLAAIIVMLVTIAFLCQPRNARVVIRSNRDTSARSDSSGRNRCDGGYDAPPEQRESATGLSGAASEGQCLDPAGASVAATAESREGTALLVTDGNERERICRCLEGAGLEFTVASPGRETLRKITQASYDLVIIDSVIMEIAFLAALRIIEASPAVHAASMLILTDSPAYLDVDSRPGWRVDYIIRPFDERLLNGKIAGLLRGEVPCAEYRDKLYPVEELVGRVQAKIHEIEGLADEVNARKMEMQSRLISDLGNVSGVGDGGVSALENTLKDLHDQIEQLQQLAWSAEPQGDNDISR